MYRAIDSHCRSTIPRSPYHFHKRWGMITPASVQPALAQCGNTWRTFGTKQVYRPSGYCPSVRSARYFERNACVSAR